MQKNETIEKAIKSKNIQLLREYLGNICYIDANFSTGEFDSTIRYIKNSGILEEELKDKKLEGELITDQKTSPYTQDDFIEAVSKLKNNFCDERIEDVKKIGKMLYPKVETKSVAKKKSIPKKEQSHQTNIVVGVCLVAIAILIYWFVLIKK
jgi:hypothetical protein